MMSNQYKDQAVLITGAGHGIGLQIALAFANEGALVGVNDIKNGLAMETVSKITTSGGNAIALPADVRSATQVEEIVSKMAGDFGRIDILVNNAGIYPNSLIVEMTEDEWDRVWDINMKGMFLVSRSVARQMIDAEQRGKIVNISSSAALRARVGASHYCSSKAAISMFTKVMALELADYKINVNAVAPGLIEVPDWDMSPEYITSMVNITPWGRIGKPEDVSNVVLFLASEEADFMTGSIVVVDGGVAVGQNLPPS